MNSSLENEFAYEADGIRIIIGKAHATFKKNGLTIVVPLQLMIDCENAYKEFVDAENLSMLEQIRNHKK